MAFDPITGALEGIGVIGGLLGENQQMKIAKAQLALQQQQAQREQGLFNTASPYYGNILAALAGLSGLNNPTPGNPNATPGAGMAGGNFTGAPQLPYTNVSNAQLGIFANPGDAFRLRAAEDQARTETTNALHNFSFGAGQRGLYGSSIDAAGRAAILDDALKGTQAFGRQLAIQAPQTAEERLSTLGGLLNPGLGAGPTAAGLFGQGAQTALGQAGLFGQQAGGALQNYLQFNALQNGLNQFRQQPQPSLSDVQGVTGQMVDLSNAIP